MVLTDKINDFPEQPGIYKMLNQQNQVLYVGKARNLKNRVRQYFHSEQSHSAKVRIMMRHVADVEIMVTDSEMEALILECNLIKEIRPKYNVLLRDDKSYPYLKITTGETFPRLVKTRRFLQDGSLYFGPYTDAGAVNEMVQLVRQLFPLKTCRLDVAGDGKGKHRPCLNYHLGKCLAPCAFQVDRSMYLEMIRQVGMLLNGKDEGVKHRLLKEMQTASNDLEFERAAKMRDQLKAVESVTEKQKMDIGRLHNREVIAMAHLFDETCVQVLTMREGRMIGQEQHLIREGALEKTPQMISSLVKQLYHQRKWIPDELIVETELEDQRLLGDWLSMQKGRRVPIKVPQRGENRQLIELAQKNAKMFLDRRHQEKNRQEKSRIDGLLQLQEICQLVSVPSVIESVDISHTSGVESVGAVTVFAEGKPVKEKYRKYRLREAPGKDDPASMEEVMERRFHRMKKEHLQENPVTKERKSWEKNEWPDLILVDGASAQVNAVVRVLHRLDLDIPVAGMVKDSKHRTRWLLFMGESIDLKAVPDLWRLITLIQDETHGFALRYHQQRQHMRMKDSELLQIDGVGEARKRQLLHHFRTIQSLKKANVNEIASVKGISPQLAKTIVNHFRQTEKNEGKEGLE